MALLFSEALSFNIMSKRWQYSAITEQSRSSSKSKMSMNVKNTVKSVIASSLLFGLFSSNEMIARADEASDATVSSSSSTADSIPVVPVYKNKGSDLQKYAGKKKYDAHF